ILPSPVHATCLFSLRTTPAPISTLFPYTTLFRSVLVSVVALTDVHQAGKMEFHHGFDLVRRNVVTTRFQTLRQLFGTAEHAHRLAADIHLEKKRVALTGFHAINLGDDRMNRTPFS